MSKVLANYDAKISNTTKKKLVFLIDDASFDKSTTVIENCKLMEMELVIIPSGTTSVLQPLDVVINKPFKDQMKNKYVSWLISACQNEESYVTKSGYMKPPELKLILEWIQISKKSIKREHILTSFIKTCITSNNRMKEICVKLDLKIEEIIGE